MVLAAGDVAGRPSVVLAPDRHGRGTNALLLDPPDVIDPAFGGDSRAGHAWLASSADAAFVEVPDVLGLDVDTPDDLLLAERQGGGRRSVSTELPDGRVEILALAGLPEVREGDDLEAMIGDALEATMGALPFQDGDVLVVTQKVVSKAEGAVVDLRDGRRHGPRPSPGPRRGAATRARSRSSCARRAGSCGCRTAC